MQNHVTASAAAAQPAFQYFMPAARCPICDSPPVLLWIDGEYQYECGCERGVYEYVERFAPEAEYPLEACRNQADALEMWNGCVSFYVANLGRSQGAQPDGRKAA